ncbi:unnamed protein product, partial [Tetraodon nigroviridis]
AEKQSLEQSLQRTEENLSRQLAYAQQVGLLCTPLKHAGWPVGHAPLHPQKGCRHLQTPASPRRPSSGPRSWQDRRVQAPAVCRVLGCCQSPGGGLASFKCGEGGGCGQTLTEKTKELEKLRSEWTSQSSHLSSRHSQEMQSEREKSLEVSQPFPVERPAAGAASRAFRCSSSCRPDSSSRARSCARTWRALTGGEPAAAQPADGAGGLLQRPDGAEVQERVRHPRPEDEAGGSGGGEPTPARPGPARPGPALLPSEAAAAAGWSSWIRRPAGLGLCSTTLPELLDLQVKVGAHFRALCPGGPTSEAAAPLSEEGERHAGRRGPREGALGQPAADEGGRSGAGGNRQGAADAPHQGGAGAAQQQKESVEESAESKDVQIKKLEATVKSLSEELIKGNGIIKKLQGEVRGLVGKIKVKNSVTVSQERLLKDTADKL